LTRLLLLAAGFLFFGCSDNGNPTAADLAIENVTVIDALGGTRANMRVVIDDGLILAVAPMAEPSAASSADAAPEANVIRDASGLFLIPGLWDMHVHFLYDEELTDIMAREFLHYGITSVRDTGGDIARLAALRAQLQESDAAPSVYYAGPLLDGRFVVYDGGDPGRPKLGTSVAQPAMARQQVQALKDQGADLIKIYELVAPDTYQALADAAREIDLPIASHVPLMMTADQAGPLADSMEHLRNIELACAANWQELLQTRQHLIAGFVEGRGFDLRRELHSLQRLPAIAAYDETRCDEVLQSLQQTIQVPTLRLNAVGYVAPYEREDWSAALARLPEAVQKRWQASADAMRDAAATADFTFAEWSLFLISRLQANGVPIGAGTDTPIGIGIPGYSLHTELELLVKAGLTPAQALYSETVTPAAFFHIEDQVGTIAPGMRADLLLLEADPLQDIANTRQISDVMIRGRWVQIP